MTRSDWSAGRWTSLHRHLAFAFALCAFAVTANAHTPDTSYCKIAIARDAVEFTFSFDLMTLRRMTPIDTNHDGRISQDELQAATPGIEKFIRDKIYLELNERESAFGSLTPPPWPRDAKKFIAQADWSQQLIALSFRNSVLHAPDSVALTFDFFETLGEQHTVLGNFIWDGRENPVIFTRFEPDYLFDTGYRVPRLEQFRQYLWLGITHIFLGYDHVAFLIALLFVRRFRDLIKIITAFTVAHTLTLALAALGVISVPSRLVETAIAASIVYVAAQNLWQPGEPAHRWRITFAFGLVHGFGFATVLRELGLPADGMVQCLLSFNLGVEIGQLAIAAVCWPVLNWISRQPWSHRARSGISWALLGFGAAWLIERAFALKFMPL